MTKLRLHRGSSIIISTCQKLRIVFIPIVLITVYFNRGDFTNKRIKNDKT